MNQTAPIYTEYQHVQDLVAIYGDAVGIDTVNGGQHVIVDFRSKKHVARLGGNLLLLAQQNSQDASGNAALIDHGKKGLMSYLTNGTYDYDGSGTTALESRGSTLLEKRGGVCGPCFFIFTSCNSNEECHVALCFSVACVDFT
jgi:hypothetical protein